MRSLTGVPFLVVLFFSMAACSRQEDIPLPKLPMSQEEAMSQPNIEKMLDEAVSLVEKSEGVRFKKRPAIRFGGTHEVCEAIVPMMIDTLRVQNPYASSKDILLAARMDAITAAIGVIARYLYTDHSIIVNVNRFRDIRRKDVATPDVLRALIIHEVVHALDEENYKALSRETSHLSNEEYDALGAVIEGHAQAVTRKLVDKSAFAGTEAIVLGLKLGATPEGTEGGGHVSYYYGRLFWEALEGRKHPMDVFKNPPKTTKLILDPSKY